MARPNPRRRIDQLAREAERALEAQRESVLLPDAALNDAASVRRSDVDAAISLWTAANAGTEVERLLNGPAREDERE